MKQRFFLLLFCLLVACCVREEPIVDAGIKTFYRFTATFEETPMTKVHLENGGDVKWDNNDCIGVFSDMQGPVPFYRKGDGSFVGDEPVSGTVFYAYYPYSKIQCSENNPMVLVPSDARDDTSKLVMVAQSVTPQLNFKQTGGMLHFSVKCTSGSWLSFSLSGMDREWLREYTIDLNTDSPVQTINGQGSDGASHARNVAPFKSVRQGDVWDLYFPMPVVTLKHGFRLNINVSDASYHYLFNYFRDSDRELSIERGVMTSFPLLDVEAEIEQEERIGEIERDALIAFYQALDGDHWKNNTNWCSDKPLDQWYGVVCSSSSGEGKVKSIALIENRLRGELPDVFGSFKYLKEINLNAVIDGVLHEGNQEDANIITGPIPESIGEATALEDISLSSNSISGTLPESIRNLKSLRRIEIGGAFNKDGFRIDGYGYLSGCLPEWLGELESLTALLIQRQNFSGPLPSFISTKEMSALWLNGNHFSGPLPEFESFAAMHALLLNGNEFSGSVPACYAKTLDLPRTQLLGHYMLAIQGNHLSGPLPEAITNHPAFADYAWCFLADQQPGYGITVDKIPAIKHTYEMLGGGTLDLGEVYPAAEYTMIVRWDEWCPFSYYFVPNAIEFAKQYRDKGLKTIWAYGGGDEVARQTYMSQTGLDQLSPHIIESYGYEYHPEEECPIWVSWDDGYFTPFVEIVDKEGNVLFIDDPRGEFSQQPFSYTRAQLEAFLADLFNDSRYESIDYSADGDVHILQTATIGNGINIVLMGDAFSDRLIADGTYENMMERAMEALFSEEPYKSDREYFNVYCVDVVSKNEVYNGETALETWYGDGTQVGGNNSKVFEYASAVLGENQLDDALIIVMMNRDYYAGTCYMFLLDSGDYGRGPSIAYFPTSSDNITFDSLVSHEAGGHGFAKLADEYAYEDMGAMPDEEKEGMNAMVPYGWWKNADFTGDPLEVKWAQFIADSRYDAENIGCYEGALTYWTGAWRPTEESIMNHNTGGFNAPSRYAIWYRINKLAYGDEWNGTYEDFVQYDKVNRTPAAMAKRKAQRRNFVENDFQPLAPPVVVYEAWREAL